MEAHSRWYDDIVKEISLHKDILGKKESKKYKLDLLLRIAGRVDSFLSHCGECQIFQQDITQLTQDLGYIVQASKEKRKGYFKKINNITKHLQKHHKLITEGHYTGIGIAIGVGIGAVLGAIFDNPGIGTGIGTAIGLAIGAYLDKKAKKEGRVI
jgi:ElaB/YqjD/DUF883 family membrane-anchored ribosome-binding protein